MKKEKAYVIREPRARCIRLGTFTFKSAQVRRRSDMQASLEDASRVNNQTIAGYLDEELTQAENLNKKR